MIFKRWELRHTADPLDTRLYKGDSGPENKSETTTENQDKRNAVEGGVAVSGDGSSAVVNFHNNDPDVVKAIAAAGTDTLKNLGGAIVDLNKDSLQSNAKAFDSVVKAGVDLVDKLIDKSTGTADKAIAAFKPVEGANADVAKWVAGAAALAVAAIMMKKGK